MYVPTLVWSTHDATQRASTRPTIVQDVVGPGFRNVGCLTDWLKIGENVWQICDNYVNVKCEDTSNSAASIIDIQNGAAMIVNRCQQIWWLQWTYLSLLIFCHKLATSANSWTFSMVGVSSGKIVTWVGIICGKMTRPSPWSGHPQALCMPHSDLRHAMFCPRKMKGSSSGSNSIHWSMSVCLKMLG